MTAAVFCRPGRQDDGAGHQHLQQDHQDEVEVDLKAGSRNESGYVLHVETDWENMMRWKQKEKGVCYINGRRVQDQFASEPNQAGGGDGEGRHVDHLEVRHLGKKKKKVQFKHGSSVFVVSKSYSQQRVCSWRWQNWRWPRGGPA